jgi:restriction system protein
MDWFEFEQFVAHLFEQLGIGKAREIRKGRDAGKDIIIQSPQGLVIVECKHHPKGSIGRPVVQKLHSAVVTANAVQGFVVTTGHFSEGATKYARDLDSRVELVDARILYDMANRAGIKLLKKGERTSVFHIIPPPHETLEKNLLWANFRNVASFPSKPNQLSRTNVLSTEFVPAYLLEYNLHQTFSTSVGVIHRIHVDKAHILLNGENGSTIPSTLERTVSQSYMVEDWQSLDKTNVRWGNFKIGFSTAKKIGTRRIKELNTCTVGYYGANNVHYTKKCVPNISSILVRSLTQVYIPILTISFQVLARQHELSLCGNPEVVEILGGVINTCEVCGSSLSEKRLLCNSCGKIVHRPRILFGHSYYCYECKKTICIECTYWFRKYYLFKKKICKDCAEKLANEGTPIKKFSPNSFIT